MTKCIRHYEANIPYVKWTKFRYAWKFDNFGVPHYKCKSLDIRIPYGQIYFRTHQTSNSKINDDKTHFCKKNVYGYVSLII